MAKYEAIEDFRDLEDNGFVYLKGDAFPREDHEGVSEERIKELKGKTNKLGKPVIKEVKETKKAKETKE